MFSKILIANRGEIACRVIRTARRMGIATVAVYSDADARAPHVRMADEAVHIGPSPAAESYLRADAIIAACKATGAEAVHPGYGFLSERASFVEALEAERDRLHRPAGERDRGDGRQDRARSWRRPRASTSCPASSARSPIPSMRCEIAAEIGYPVMMKASRRRRRQGHAAGLWTSRTCARASRRPSARASPASATTGCSSRSSSSSPRHIEIQVLGDQHGNLVYLSERECSIQRRHQKVVEEAPVALRHPGDAQGDGRAGGRAGAGGRAITRAGTVELIVSGADPTGESFYFLEMNTRLQVEHPVTEAITGLDLVEQMIRVAAGETLPFAQDEVDARPAGRSRAGSMPRIPYRGFLPSTGRLVRCYRRSAEARGGWRASASTTAWPRAARCRCSTIR